MKFPVRVLSDLHLGHKVSRLTRAESLRPLLAGAGTVIFNGDTWQELATSLRPKAEMLLGTLKKICAEENCEAVFLSGNHDPGWSGAGFVSLADGKIIVTHGDALLFASSPWKREILENRDILAAIWSAHPRAETNAEERLHVAREIARRLKSIEYPTGRSFFQRAWDAVHPPQRAFAIIDAWLRQSREGGKFCDRYFPNAEVLVIGHFHRTGCWLENGRRIINTGSFMNPGRAHWVEWDGTFLSRGIIAESPNTCTKGRTLDVWKLG